MVPIHHINPHPVSSSLLKRSILDEYLEFVALAAYPSA